MRSAWRLDDPELEWQRRAACATTSVEEWALHADSFFRNGPISRGVRDICSECPVRQECEQFALDNDLEGIWGATMTAQRRRTRAKKGAVA